MSTLKKFYQLPNSAQSCSICASANAGDWQSVTITPVSVSGLGGDNPVVSSSGTPYTFQNAATTNTSNTEVAPLSTPMPITAPSESAGNYTYSFNLNGSYNAIQIEFSYSSNEGGSWIASLSAVELDSVTYENNIVAAGFKSEDEGVGPTLNQDSFVFINTQLTAN